MEAKIRRRIQTIITLARGQDWEDRTFSAAKAQVCVELSALVYEDVQECELKKHSRIHLFASDAFRRRVEGGHSNRFLEELVEEEFEAQFFVVRGRGMALLGSILGEDVFLAVRGTGLTKLWDWKANIDARRFAVEYAGTGTMWRDECVNLQDQFFHRGFFEAIAPQFNSIIDNIVHLRGQRKPVNLVWTGHSLGGAMAAIGYAMFSHNPNIWHHRERFPFLGSAYTFGMPRYGGLGSVCRFPGPHHIYKKRDLVPSVPLRRMGFTDSAREYELTDAGHMELAQRTDTWDLAGHVPSLFSSLVAHGVDGYASAISRATGIPRPLPTD